MFHWTEGRVRSHVLVCFLALALESALERRLRELAPDLAYTQVRQDLEQLRAVRLEARGKAWLWRTELPGASYQAFRAVGLRPPPRVQPLTS